MLQISPPGSSPERSERPNAYLDRRTKDHIASTFLVLKHSYDAIEAAKQLLETVRSRRQRLPGAEDPDGETAAAGGALGAAHAHHTAV
jgi:hypothetical protein